MEVPMYRHISLLCCCCLSKQNDQPEIIEKQDILHEL